MIGRHLALTRMKNSGLVSWWNDVLFEMILPFDYILVVHDVLGSKYAAPTFQLEFER